MEDERPLGSYVCIHVRRNEVDNVNVYLARPPVYFQGESWLTITADGWLWGAEADSRNYRECFDTPKRMTLPSHRVTEIYWPEGVES